MKKPKNKDRAELLKLLKAVDDEAFSWLVLALPASAAMGGGRMQVWPDGLGGFRDRATLEKIRAAATKWLGLS